MPAKQDDQKQKEQEKRGRAEQDAAIGRHVMASLGQPINLHRIQVRRLWEDHYRVNIFIGADSATARLVHSFFLVADSGGNILASTPKIARQY
jgi:hypothetical protein